MKRSIIFLLLVITLAGGAIVAMSGPSAAQGYYMARPVQPVVMQPYVGTNTPWTFYKGDWFMNGILYYFFGPKIGFAPYYAYPQVYIVRPQNWYAPGWNAWYQARPQYWNNFERQYPQWRAHQIGAHYDQNFYNRYNHGQGGGWNRGFQGANTQGGPGFHPQGGGPGFHPQGGTPGTIPRELALRATILRELALPAIVLKGVPVPFRGIVLKGVLFRGTIPREVALRDIILREAQLPGTIPREVALRDIILREAQLPGTIPREVALRDIILREAHLLNISLPLPAVLNLRHPLLMRNIISRNSPAAARSQIAPPGAIWAFFES